MSISRRKFLKVGTLVALSAAIPVSVFGQNRKDGDGNPVDQQPIQLDPSRITPGQRSHRM